MLASKYLYEHYKKMSIFLMMGINVGMIIAVFFGNFLYQLTAQNMTTPILIFVGVDLGLYLPLALWVIPRDSASHLPVSTATPRDESNETAPKGNKSDTFKVT